MFNSPANMFSALQSIRVLQLADTATAFGLDPTQLFQGVLDIDQVRGQQTAPTWHDSICMMGCLMQAAGDQPVALDFGKRWSISSYGALGILIFSMQNLQAVFCFADEITHLVGLESPYVFEHGPQDTRLWLKLSGWNVSAPIQRFIAESLFVSYQQTARLLVGGPFPLKSVSFSHSRPPYGAELEAQFSCPVHFNQADNAVTFAAALMEQPFPTHNPHIVSAGLATCRAMLKDLRHSDKLAERVKIELNKTPGNYPGRAAMAKRFLLESRTFSRRLESEGVVYSDLLNEAKASYARQLLAETDHTTQEIAARIGYSDEANFRRAFKSWTGKSPADYRNEHLTATKPWVY